MSSDGLRDLTFGFRAARAVMAGVSLGIFDALRENASSIDELADSIGIDRRGAAALVRALASLGLLEEDIEGRIQLDRGASNAFASQGEGSRANVVLHDLWHWGLWSRLDESVRSGRAIADRSGDLFFSDPAVLARFFPNLAAAMGQTSSEEAPLVAAVIDPPRGGRFLDLGAGLGNFGIALAERRPDLEVALFDAAPVAVEARRCVARLGLSEWVKVCEGDFFETPLDDSGEGYDAILLSRVVMGLTDERAVELLDRCRSVLRPGGRIHLHEFRGGTGPAERIAALLDLDMLLLTGGSVRRPREIRVLAEKAGLRTLGEVPIGELGMLLEVAP